MRISARHAKGVSRLHLSARLMTEFPMHFFKYYIIRRHITGGLNGLRYASLQAGCRFLRIYRMMFTSWRDQIDTPQSEDPSGEFMSECNVRNR
jgi:hypothetical protein